MKELTDNEAKVIGELFQTFAKRELEDIIGLLMRHGAFRDLPEDKLVNLSRKLEDFSKIKL